MSVEIFLEGLKPVKSLHAVGIGTMKAVIGERLFMAENDSQAPPTINPPPPSSSTPSGAPPPANPENQARMWNMWCHLSALAGCLGIPFGNIIGPVVVWQIKKNEFPSVDYHGKAALNFQITATIAIAVLVISGFILSFFCVGYLLFPVAGLIGLADLVFTIIAGIKANDGVEYKYPYSFEFVK
jgi:hypothetical protein